MNEIELVEYTERMVKLHDRWNCKASLDTKVSKLEAELMNLELERRGVDCRVIPCSRIEMT